MHLNVSSWIVMFMITLQKQGFVTCGQHPVSLFSMTEKVLQVVKNILWIPSSLIALKVNKYVSDEYMLNDHVHILMS